MRRVNRLASVVGIGLAFVARAASAQVAHQVVADFSTIGASQPMGGLVRGPDGALYGTTWSDDIQGCGTIYRFEEPDTLTLVHRFQLPAGCNPVGDLAVGPDGTLYGATYAGGANGAGTVFRLPADGVVEPFVDLPAVSPGGPYSGLTFGQDGRLYGSTAGSSLSPLSKLFALSLDGTLEILPASPYNVQAALTRNPAGGLLGVDSAELGTGGRVFQLAPDGTLTTIVDFPLVPLTNPAIAAYGAEPMSELVVGPNGSVYGTARSAGPTGGSGTVFRLCNPGVVTAPCYTPSGGRWTIDVLHEFAAPAEGLHPLGGHPWAGVILGSDGGLYGTTYAGGANAAGTMYRVTPGGAFELLHSFGGLSAGVSPEARLFETSPGVFYALTSGRIHRLALTTSRPPVAEAISTKTDEDVPLSGVLAASDPDGDPLTFSLASNGSLGTATIVDVATGAFSYAPNRDANGIDTFTFRVSDGMSDSNVATVTVTIAPVNDAPVAAPGTLAVVEDVPMSGQLLATDVDSATLTYAIVTAPSLGSVALDAATGAYTYNPSPNANGTDSFSFQASDGAAASSPAQIAITFASVADATETTVSSSPNPSSFGGLVTLSATVTALAGVPSGLVQFRRGTVNLGAAQLDGAGFASATTMQLSVGDVAITATYLGNAEYAPSTSAGSPHTVLPGLRLIPQLPANTGQSPWALAVGDFDRDGRPDVVTTNTATAGINVLRGYGPGGFAGADSYHSGSGPIAVTTSDLDGDGRLDIVVGNQGSRTISVLRGTTTGNFEAPVNTPVSAVPRSVAAADVNGDGNPDVVVAHSVPGAAYVGVLLGNGDGTLQAPVDYPGGDGAIAVGDLDGDGRLDIANTAFNGDTARVLIGLGDGAFVPGNTWSVPRTPWAVVATDVNDDAVSDIVVLSANATGSHDLVNVLLGQGAGAFAAAVAYPVASATSLVALDADQDGVTDLAVAGRNTNTVSLLRGLGGGAFESAVAYSGGAGPTGIGVADFNGDGAPDVVASNNDSNSVTVFLNSGGVAMSLTARPPTSQVGQPVELAATVSPTVVGGSPDGFVSFLDGEALLGTVPVDTGRAVLTVSNLAPGSHSVVARYGGNATFNPNTSNPRVVDVAAAPLTLTVVAPNGGERVFANVPYVVRWTTTGVPTSVDVELSRDGGTTFTPIAACTGVAGTATACAWTPAAPASAGARVRVTARDASGSVADVSDADFTVATATPTATVTAPNTAVAWRIGTVQNLRWNHNLGLGSRMSVELSRDSGATWETVAASFANTAASSSTLPWTVTGPVTTSALLRVTWLDGPGTSDVSNVPFAVVRPAITVTAPNTAVAWSIGSSRAITWTHNLPAGDTVDLDVSRDGGATWTAIATGVATTATAGNYNWVVSGPESTIARIRVRWSADALANDASNVDFSVVAPVVTITAPNTAVTWRVGNTQTLRATHNLGVGQAVAFDLSADDGATWTELTQVTTGTSNAVTYPWTVALPTSNAARIRARWVASPMVADASDVAFRIIPRITVTAPNTAVSWGAGSTRTVSWTHNLGTSEPVDIAFSADGGASWTTVAAAVASTTATTGTASVVLPATPTSAGVIRVSQSSDPVHFDVSDVSLTLAPPTITVTAPNSNVNWTVGSARNITWSHNLGNAERVTIELSRDGGASWEPLAAGVLNSGNTLGTWPWTVSGPTTAAGRIRVTWDRNGIVQDVGNVNFRIQ